MPAITRFVLRHKALVTLFWVVVAAVGVMTISGTGGVRGAVAAPGRPGQAGIPPGPARFMTSWHNPHLTAEPIMGGAS